MTLAEAVETIRPSIVQISYFGVELLGPAPKPVRGSLGTGFLISSDGYMITAQHVIREGEAFLERIEAARKQMLVGLALPNTENVRGNFSMVEFDVVDEDQRHDLALLKLKRNPFKGQVRSGIVLDAREMPLPVGVASISPRRPQDGAAVAVSGYPLGEPVLVTTAGWIASSWSFDLNELQSPGAPHWIPMPDIADSYLADVTANRGNSGGPIYLAENGVVIGVCVATQVAPVEDQNDQEVTIIGHRLLYNAGLAVVVPSRYVIELLRKHNLNWCEAAD